MIYTIFMREPKVAVTLHHIRKHIVRILAHRKWARFRDMKPRNIESNLYNYHLKELIKEGYVEHNPTKGYRLSPVGLRFVDHVSFDSFTPRWQPKILTKLVSINQSDQVLLWPKYKQPFIDKWSLPSGKVHFDDVSLEEAMKREIGYFSNQPAKDLEPAGVVEYRAFIEDNLVTHTIAHVFKGTINPSAVTNLRTKWVSLEQLDELETSPGTRETIDRFISSDGYFIASFDIDW